MLESLNSYETLALIKRDVSYYLFDVKFWVLMGLYVHPVMPASVDSYID